LLTNNAKTQKKYLAMTKTHLTSKIIPGVVDDVTKTPAETTAGTYYYSLKTANTNKSGKVVISK
jgi:hypothetical protein